VLGDWLLAAFVYPPPTKREKREKKKNSQESCILGANGGSI
jgi:hypothetical protein